MSVILFLAILAILIFVHELGHFSLAKLFRIRVDEFAIGFPPRLIRARFGETLYTLNAIPFGGFVKIFGENPDEMSLHGPDSERSFARAKRPTQALVLLAGVSFNVLFAWLLLSGALMLGVPSGREGSALPLTDERVAIVEVLSGSPAEKAGFKVGDSITFVTSNSETLEHFNADSLRSFVGAHGGETITFTVSRGKEIQTIEAHGELGIIPNTYAIGFALGDFGTLTYPPLQAITQGAKLTASLTYDTARGLLSFIGKAFQGAADLSSVTGPVGIAGMVGEASDFGFAYLLSFAAFISINLAVINLLPFPALDGGRLFILVIESIVRRPLNQRFVNMVNATGFILLMLLMVAVTWQDISRIW